MRVVRVKGFEVVALRQDVEAAGVGIGDEVAFVVLVVGQRSGVSVGTGEESHLRRARSGGDDGGFLVAVEHLQAANHGVHGGEAAHLLGPVGLEYMDHALSRHARQRGLSGIAAASQLAEVEPVGHGAIQVVDLDAHHGLLAGGEVLAVGDGKALDFQQAQGVSVGVAGFLAGQLQEQRLAIARPGFDHGTLHVDEGIATADFAHAAPRPLRVGLLDQLPGGGVGLALFAGLALQGEAGRADDVGNHKRQVLAGEFVVLGQVASAVARGFQPVLDLVIGRHTARAPARREPVRQGGFVVAGGVDDGGGAFAHGGRRLYRLAPQDAVENAHQNLTRSLLPPPSPAAMRSARFSAATRASQTLICSRISATLRYFMRRPAISYSATWPLLAV